MASRGWILWVSAIAVGGCSDDGAGAGSDGTVNADAAIPDAALPDRAIDPDRPAVDASASADLATPDASGWSGPELLFLDGESGLGGPIVDASPDEAGNFWAVAPDALYILRRGEKNFRRYTNADGLQIFSTITAVAGAGPNEGFVGLEGFESDDPDNDTLEEKMAGKAERVRLLTDGTISALHYADIHNDDDANAWETQSARRLLYAHDGPNAQHLFLGGNHGITDILADGWGDHVHVEVWWMPENEERQGEWYGLAIDPLTDGLWTCGRFACGLQNFVADPRAWVTSHGYLYAFTTFSDDHGLAEPSGYQEHDVGVAVTPDGTAWFLSTDFGLARWQPNQRQDYSTIERVAVPGLGVPVDVAADPDGTLWIADRDRVLRFDPQTGGATPLALPSGDVRRLYLDLRSSPRGLFVSTGGGLAIYHGP